MRKRKFGIAAVVTAAMCVSMLGAGTALAAGTTELPEGNANWTIPTTPMTNTVWKDADGNVVAEGTEGATQYKVLTTWAEAWSTSGADFLGISNSAYYGNGGNGNASIQTIDMAQHNTTAGVWATSANKNPNAYNWNKYYNLYATVGEGADLGVATSDWAAVSTGNTDGVNSWSTESGVWVGFKYRPDVVVTNNNLSENNAITYIGYIQNGMYSATATNNVPDPMKDENDQPIYDPDGEPVYDQSFYVYGDENYDPYIMGYNNNGPYSFVASDYELAQAAQDVIDATAGEEGLNGNALDWKTVNMLPRSNRYTESPMDCALNVEMLAKGSVYYVLDQVAKGNVDKKKVAYVSYIWGHSASGGGNQGPGGRNSLDANGDIQTLDTATTESQVVVTVFDFTENIGNGPTDGRASFSPVAVDQLGACEGDDLEVATEKSSAGAVNSDDNSTTTYVQYKATADDIASCDVVYCGPDATANETEWKDWIETYATTDELKARADEIQYLTDWMCITNGSNFSQEKFMYGSFGLDTVYPELFPNMELSCFWCDNIYHINSESLQSAMSWIYSTASLPAGVELSDIPATYNSARIVAKFNDGLDYYVNSQTATGSTDPTIDRILNNVALDGTTVQPDGTNPYAFNGFSPTQYWLGTADESNINRTELEAAIAAAEALNSENYTEETWETLLEALEDAKAVLDNPASTHVDLQDATDALLDAMNGLELKPGAGVVKDLLEAAITRAGALNEADYTAASWANMQEELAAAVSVDEDANATQNEVDEATAALNAAIDALEYATSESTTKTMTVYAGENRYETANAIAAAVAEQGPYKGVIVCSAASGKFADALCASGLSGVLDYPIVLTDGSLDSLDAGTAAAISALFGGGQGDVIVLGGSSTISNGIRIGLGAYDTSGAAYRIAGEDRYDTADAIYAYGAKHGSGWSTDYAVLAVGNNFPDALGAASFCTSMAVPMLLTNQNSDDLEAYAANAAAKANEVIVIGGTNSVSDAKSNSFAKTIRMAGVDRYDTNLQFAAWQIENGMTLNGAGVATGTNFPDSLGSSYLLSLTNSVLLLSSPTDNSALYSLLSGNASDINAISVFGGDNSVSADVKAEIQSAIGGEWEVK